jgi:hypothetical protein
LHEVWLDETGRCHGKEDLLRQRHQNEDLMHARHRETCERAGPAPCWPTPIKNNVSDGAAISDDDIVVFALNIQNPRESSGMMMMAL